MKPHSVTNTNNHEIQISKLSSQLRQTLSEHLGKSLNLIPANIKSLVASAAANTIFKSPLQDQELDFLTDKWLKLTIRDLNFCCFITVLDDAGQQPQIKVTGKLPEGIHSAAVEFSSDLPSLARVASKQADPDTLFFQRKLIVEGETELGLAIKNFLDDFNQVDCLPLPVQKVMHQLRNLHQRHFAVR